MHLNIIFLETSRARIQIIGNLGCVWFMAEAAASKPNDIVFTEFIKFKPTNALVYAIWPGEAPSGCTSLVFAVFANSSDSSENRTGIPTT